MPRTPPKRHRRAARSLGIIDYALVLTFAGSCLAAGVIIRSMFGVSP